MRFALLINFFYDHSPDQELSTDPEGNLVMLCADCRDRHAHEVEWAAQGDAECICELCDAPQKDLAIVLYGSWQRRG